MTPPHEHLTVLALRFFGRGTCLCRIEHRDDHLLASGVLPGERAHVRRLDIPGPARWHATDILDPSRHRIAPGCPVAAQCAGCALLHLERVAEVDSKARTLQEILERHAGLRWPAENIERIATDAREGLRHRTTWTLRRTPDGDVQPCFRTVDRDWVPTGHCAAVRGKLKVAIGEVARLCGMLNAEASSEVSLEEGRDGIGMIVRSGDPAWPGERDPFLVPRVVSAVAVQDGPRSPVTVRAGRWPAPSAIGEVHLPPAPGVWQHATPACAIGLHRWVLDVLADGGASLLDATCGAGGLLVALASLFGRVVAVDRHHAAVLAARRACLEQGLENVDVRGGRIETVAPRLVRDGARFHTVLVNPMRRSLGDSAMAQLAALTGRTLLYLAPAPRAGASDIAALMKAGLAPRRVALVDLHPGTAAMMMGVRLDRAV
ncbi:MAG: methyltransferase domain-containing protein [Deltaproteobacteria bacterium]|nr:MAG: methyltransferase domain-containing protein [Deltaproteobacteria bacterium]